MFFKSENEIRNPSKLERRKNIQKCITYTLPSLPLALTKSNYYLLFKALTKKEKVRSIMYVHLLICIKQITLYPLVTTLFFSLVFLYHDLIHLSCVKDLFF